MSEAVIVALIGFAGAVLGALITGIFAKWNDIATMFQSKPRKISGEWKGVSYMLHNGFIVDTTDSPTREPEIHYEVELTQIGRKVKGTLKMTAVTGDGRRLYNHTYTGFVKGDYFVYTLDAVEPHQFRLSTAMLYILNDGDIMRGYYVANSGRKDPGKTIVGYTIMNKVKK